MNDDSGQIGASKTQPRAPRKNIFLAATIVSGQAVGPVRIRNMSETGAMLEGAFLPMPGTRLVLERQEMRIEADVVWVVGGRCGIRFDGVAFVDDWIAGKQTGRANELQGQARVDAIQAAVRSGSNRPSMLPAVEAADAIEPSWDILARIASETAALERSLSVVADQLSDDPLILSRHLNSIQTLQGAIEILNHLTTVIGASDMVGAADRVVLQALRARLLAKALF
jgi:hypothetical protein